MKIKKLITVVACSFLFASCTPPMSAVIDQSSSKKIAAKDPVSKQTTKVYVECDVSWGGEPAPIARGYFTKRVTNALITIPGFTLSDKENSVLMIKISRNNKWDKSEMNEKLKRVISKQSDGEAIVNKYDHFFHITGQGRTWSGNIPHQIYMVVGNTTSSNVAGQIYTGSSGALLDFKELTQGDEAMIREVLVFALNQAKNSGCFN
jgi:hypothetical protein